MPAPPLDPIVAAVQQFFHHRFEAPRMEQTRFQMIDHRAVQPVHRHGDAAASRLALPRLGRAGIIAVVTARIAGAGAERHRATARRAEADARQQDGAGHGARRHDDPVARLERRLHRVIFFLGDDRRHFHDGMFGLGLGLPRLVAARVEAMLPDIGRAGEQQMQRGDAPAPAVARADIIVVEPGDDLLETHRATIVDAVQRHAIDAAHRLGMDRINFQLLLGLGAALLGRDDAIADRRQRPVPEALPGILVHRPQRVLGILLRLIFIEQRHDLAHHHAHRIIAQILRDRDQPHAVLRQLADIELELELVAEEAREAMDEDDGERRRLFHRCVDHRLEGGTPIVGRGIARLDELGGDLPAFAMAVLLHLPPLIGDRQIVLGLPRRRHPNVERNARGGDDRRRIVGGKGGMGHGTILRISGQGAEQFVQLLRQMAFDRPQFGVADGNLLRPVVSDDDRAIVHRRAPGRSPFRAWLEIVMQVFETFRPAGRRAAPAFTRQGHAPKLANRARDSSKFAIVV